MLINSTRFMYETFLSCRHSLYQTGELLPPLRKIFDLTKQQGRFTIELPDDWVNTVDEFIRQTLSKAASLEHPPADALTSGNYALVSLLDIGIAELQRLWKADAKPAVRSLGYAFHMLPDLLRCPEKFSPDGYMFCFGLVSRHWDDYSEELRLALCKVVGLKLSHAEALINSPKSSVILWKDLPRQ